MDNGWVYWKIPKFLKIPKYSIFRFSKKLIFCYDTFWLLAAAFF